MDAGRRSAIKKGCESGDRYHNSPFSVKYFLSPIIKDVHINDVVIKEIVLRTVKELCQTFVPSFFGDKANDIIFIIFFFI